MNIALESGDWAQSIIWDRRAPFKDFTQLFLQEEEDEDAMLDRLALAQAGAEAARRDRDGGTFCVFKPDTPVSSDYYLVQKPLLAKRRRSESSPRNWLTRPILASPCNLFGKTPRVTSLTYRMIAHTRSREIGTESGKLWVISSCSTHIPP